MTPEQEEHRRNIAELTDKVLDDKHGNPGPFKTEIEKLKGKGPIMTTPKPTRADLKKARQIIADVDKINTKHMHDEPQYSIAQAIATAREEGRLSSADVQGTPKVFTIQEADTGKIGIAWRPDEEAGGCTVLSWVSDEMVQIRADHMAANRLSLPTNAPEGESDE